MNNQKRELRIYPACCTSMFCGKGTCPPTCKNKPILDDFKAWKKEHAAVQDDPIWCPNAWTSTK